MRHLFTLFITLWLVGGTAVPAQTGPATEQQVGRDSLIFFVQQDLRPEVTKLGFDEGFQDFLGRLDPGRPIEFYFYMHENVKQVHAGPAGELPWPPLESFAVPVPSTTPYKNLLRFLRDNEIRNRPVIFISNGVSQDMLQLVDTVGFLRGADTFSPTRYQPIEDLRRYCKKNSVKLIGIYVPVRSRYPGVMDEIPLNAFRYVVETSGGKSYYNFNTFTGVLRAIEEKELTRK
ncbi:MAG: hypothetical protein JXQ27_13675 [Acidobacteria bacterium]|nr:hypothetical protein [Acidobacteriota bacterium]